MQFEDAAQDDEQAASGDVLATSQEIETQARAVYVAASVRRRLFKASEYILERTTLLKRRCQPEDLLQEALLVVLNGQRIWKKNRVDFVGLLIGVMRSLASSQDASLQTKDSHVLVESELESTSEVGDDVSILDRFGNDDGSPEAVMLNVEHDAEIERVFSAIRANFDQDDLAGLIVGKLAERRGYTLADIREALGVSDREFWNAHRRVTRAIVDFQKKESSE